jgi:hypothetical protein
MLFYATLNYLKLYSKLLYIIVRYYTLGYTLNYYKLFYFKVS